MCVTLVIYQESLHDARSTKYKEINGFDLCDVMRTVLDRNENFDLIATELAWAKGKSFSRTNNVCAEFLLDHCAYYPMLENRQQRKVTGKITSHENNGSSVEYTRWNNF